jgi:hypothetical protein
MARTPKPVKLWSVHHDGLLQNMQNIALGMVEEDQYSHTSSTAPYAIQSMHHTTCCEGG